MKLNIILFIYFITSLLGLMYVVNKQPITINNEPHNDKVLTVDGLFNYDSNVRITEHVQLNGRDYIVINIQSDGTSYLFDKLVPKGENVDDFKRSYYAMFKGGER